MPKKLVIFKGWSRAGKSYEKLIDLAPSDWEICSVSYEELMPHGRVDKFQENFLKFLKEHNLKNLV